MERFINLIGIDKNQFIEITNIGIVAGSSVTYAKYEFIPKALVGFMRFFVLKNDWKDFSKLKKIFQNLDSMTECVPEYYWDMSYQDSIVNLVRFKNNAGIPIEIIQSNMENISELIEGFDLKYIQCCYYKGALHITKEAVKLFKDENKSLEKLSNHNIEVMLYILDDVPGDEIIEILFD